MTERKPKKKPKNYTPDYNNKCVEVQVPIMIDTGIEKLIVCYAKYKSDWGKYGDIDIFEYIKRTTNEALENGCTLKQYVNYLIENEVSL